MRLPLFEQTGIEDAPEVSNALTQNLIPHLPEQSKAQMVLYGTPGLKESTFINTIGEIRGSIVYGDEYYCVAGDKVYRINSEGVIENPPAGGGLIGNLFWIGTLRTDKGPVSMAHNGSNNGKEICIVDGDHLYIIVLSDAGSVMFDINDPLGSRFDANAPTGSTHVVYFDSYFIINDPSNSGRFYVSKPYDGQTWVALSFATAERSPDELQSIVASDKILFLIGTKTAEMWYNAGISGGVPFKPMQSGFMQWGTIAKHSPEEISGVVFWLTQNDEGSGMIVKSSGTAPEIVSTPAVASQLQKIDKEFLEEAISWSYQHNQHTYYVLTIPRGDLTLVYDLSTKKWHTWRTESTGCHRATCHSYVYGKHLVGDSQSSTIMELDWDYYFDMDETIVRLRRTGPISDEGAVLIHNGIELSAKTDVGNDDVTEPKIHLRWYDNKGWSNWHTRSMGVNYSGRKKLAWRGLGKSTERVYEFKITDPVDTVLIDSYALLKKGRVFGG